nr:hypothetical protein [Halomonas sp. 1513]
MKDKQKEKTDNKWRVSNLELPLLAKLMMGCALLVCILIMLGYIFIVGPGLSSRAEDWAYFGALMSGTFGMLASFAALATLLIVIQQFKSQDKITEKQIESIEFDRYDRHRRIFFERLEGIENLLENRIAINNKEELYQQIYPDNSPMRCDVKISLDADNKRVGDLSDILSCMETIKESLKNKKNTIEDIVILIRMQGLLRIEPVGEIDIGDLRIGEKRLAINMYNMSESIDRMVRVIDTILVYSGNDKLSGDYHVFSEGMHIKDKLIKDAYRLRRNNNEDGLRVHGDHVHDIYLDMYVNFASFKSSIPITEEYQKLSNLLQQIMVDRKTRNQYIKNPEDVLYIRSFLLNEEVRKCLDADALYYVQKIEPQLSAKETFLKL